jgi:hypothetical protein
MFTSAPPDNKRDGNGKSGLLLGLLGIFVPATVAINGRANGDWPLGRGLSDIRQISFS